MSLEGWRPMVFEHRITHYRYLRSNELYKMLSVKGSSVPKVKKLLSDYFGKHVIILNSARTGIYLALAAYGIKRWDETLVPKFLSQCVLNTLNAVTFPSMRLSDLTRAVLVFHQFGYPQKLDKILGLTKSKGWLLIEDCAHTFASKYKGRRVGLFGDAAVFSFPKIFPTILGGCLITDDKKIIDFANEYLKGRKSWLHNLQSNICLAPAIITYGAKSSSWRKRVMPLLEMCYSQFTEFPNPNKFVCHLFPYPMHEFKRAFRIRRKNLSIIKEYFSQNGYPSEIEENSEVTPFLVPYFHKDEDQAKQILVALSELNVETGVYHFDIARNLLQPEYRKCIPIPVHQSISENKMHRICRTIVDVST